MTAPTPYFRLDHDEATGIARLVLCRPEQMNTMAPGFFPALRDAVRGLDEAGRTRVLVIESTGRHFSAGMSLEVFGDADNPLLHVATPRQRQAFQHGLRQLMGCFDALEQARFPVICAVQGGCIGGALDLAAACDIRVCSADAFFTVQEIHIGMVADLGSLQRLPRIVAPGMARQMAYTGERVEAQRALAIGLVNAVLPDAQALAAHAGELAAQIAAKSPLAIAGSKQALLVARDHGTAEALAQMAVLQAGLFDLGEMAEAIRAWKQREPARFDALSPLAPLRTE